MTRVRRSPSLLWPALVLGIAWAVLWGGRLGAQAPQPPPPGVPSQTPSFRAGVDVVSLDVTVTDQDGHYITGLKQSDFDVYEDDVQQNLNFFDATQMPVALSLLVDTSASMEEKLSTAQQAAIGFAKQIRPQDLAEVIDFDSRVQIRQGFTSNPQQLEHAILQTSAGGSTSLYNAIYIALNELKKLKQKDQSQVRRQAIILLSDGEDTSSLVSFDEVLDLAKHSETAIYAIGIKSGELIPNRGFDEADYVLRQLAQQTGGRTFFPTHLADLAGVYGQIAKELSSQYRLGYISKNPSHDGAWRRIVVRVASRPDAIVRTKLGYYAPTTR